MEPQIRFCTSADGTRIGYATAGEGTPLLLVSMWGVSIEHTWQSALGGQEFTRELSRGRLLIDLDWRGTGASQREVDDLSMEAQVADIEAVVESLGITTFDLLGTGDGAAVATAFAAKHPERVSHLVLWSPYASGREINEPSGIRSLQGFTKENYRLALRAMASVACPSGPTELQIDLSKTLRESMTADMAARYLDFGLGIDTRKDLPLVKAPTLVLHRRGVRSAPLNAARAVAALIRDARFVAIEGNVSIPHFGDLSYIETVREFLGEGDIGSASMTPPETAVHTILFTDVEGSTALTERLGDAAARELLREHERITREALKAHSGSEVKTMGDGFMASFSSATAALECAVALQRSFEARNERADQTESLRIRIGLNAGEPIAEDDPGGRADLFGTAVNMAARIASEAKGGEILASNVVRELVAGKGFLFSDRGETELRGFEEPVRVYEVRWGEGE